MVHSHTLTHDVTLVLMRPSPGGRKPAFPVPIPSGCGGDVLPFCAIGRAGDSIPCERRPRAFRALGIGPGRGTGAAARLRMERNVLCVSTRHGLFAYTAAPRTR